ncbi:receptor-like protein 33 [Eucalyptus grandis]|uniref:receptor-like protein 33 n=1 Tax=Eucalyptus grandis TaxID=71139 RepID=UPI00192F0FC4|nr:receptor-like protein 33 [Eucalyptus grandis]
MSYIVSNNNLTGALPAWICNLSSAITLDLSSNNLTGVLPICLGNISESLLVLNLKGNNFHGSIPELSVRGMQLTMIDLSDNQLQGNLPRSLANCKKLEFINFANNLIMDTFPSWLGSLPELHILILRSNKFHGVIERPQLSHAFPKLRILDLSSNAFVGKLPMEFFQSWNAMKFETRNFTYMYEDLYPSAFLAFTYYGNYDFSMMVIYKGLKSYYPKVPKVLTIIDLSSNLLKGEIPSVIGDFKGLQGLNLSNNSFTGYIPSSLGNLTALESLDLSRNKLSGQIPQKLIELGFLSFLNLSYNNLTGSVPRGKQFDTFSNDSFEGNLGLCGDFIFTKCQPSTYQEEDLGSPIELNWKIVLMGYGSGLVIGVVIGNAFISWKHDWFEGNARRRQRPSRRQPRRVGSNPTFEVTFRTQFAYQNCTKCGPEEVLKLLIGEQPNRRDNLPGVGVPEVGPRIPPLRGETVLRGARGLQLPGRDFPSLSSSAAPRSFELQACDAMITWDREFFEEVDEKLPVEHNSLPTVRVNRAEAESARTQQNPRNRNHRSSHG